MICFILEIRIITHYTAWLPYMKGKKECSIEPLISLHVPYVRWCSTSVNVHLVSVDFYLKCMSCWQNHMYCRHTHLSFASAQIFQGVRQMSYSKMPTNTTCNCSTFALPFPISIYFNRVEIAGNMRYATSRNVIYFIWNKYIRHDCHLHILR